MKERKRVPFFYETPCIFHQKVAMRTVKKTETRTLGQSPTWVRPAP